MQAKLTQSQIGEAQARQRLASSQANNEDVKTVQSVAGMAMSVAALGALLYGADKAGLIPHSQATTQASTQTTSYSQPAQDTSSLFEKGRADWHQWHDWEASLTGSRLAGVLY
jgi:hypothetical protein